MAIYGGPDIATAGLALHLDAGSNKSYPGTGNTWYDLSGNGNHGTNANMPYSANNRGTFSFNDGSSVSLIPNSASLNPTTGLTIEAWVNFIGNTNDFIFEKGNVNTQYSLFSHGSDIMFRTVHVGVGMVNTSGLKSALNVVNGQWHHIVGSWDGAVKRIYVDNVLYVTHHAARTEPLVTTTLNAAVGRFGGTTIGYYFGGLIPKVAVYNRGLTAAEVEFNYLALRGRYL